MKFLIKYKYEVILGVAVLAYVIYFTAASFARYDNFYTGRFDLGNMAQTVWNTTQGRIFQLTDPNGTAQMSRLSVHADFILILLTPFYFLWSSPKMLLLIQSLILGMGAIFTYLLSKEILKNKIISIVFALAYLLNPAVQYVNLYDFHSVALATTFLLGAFYFIFKKRYYVTVAFLVLAGLTKEQIWAVNALIGAYLFIVHKQKVVGSFLFLSGIGLFYYLIWIAIPKALGSQHFALSYYSDFGATPTSIVKNIFLSPLETVRDLFGKDQLDYIAKLFVPFGYISFLAPLALIPTAPTLLISLLSNNPQLHQIYYQYSSDVTPFIIASAIFGIRFLRKHIPEISLNVFAVLISTYTLIAAYTYGPLPISQNPNIDMFEKPIQNKEVIENFLATIPEEYSVSSTNNLGSHLSHRQKIYTVPLGIGEADMVAFLKEANYLEFTDEIKKIIKQSENNQKYKKVISKENFIVFEKVN